ncbi:MAG: LppX_LprAFG lipoprotein [Chloroflexota bacterium]
MKILRLAICWLLGLTAVFLFIACNTPPPPTLDLPVTEIVAQSAARMQTLQGFRFVIDRSGAPAYVDPNETISFAQAIGDYVAPDRARATVRVILPGLVTELNIISIDAVQWETNVATGEWEELPPNWGFNPTVLFDNEVGLQAVLASDLSAVEFMGTEFIEDGPSEALYALRGQAAGERLFQMSNGLIGPDSVQVRLWIAPETFELHRIIATEPVADADEPSIWQVDFSEFDRVVEIAPPVVE